MNFQSQTGKTKIIRKKQRLFNFQHTDQALDKLTAASEPTQLLQESMTVIPETLVKLFCFKPLSLLVPPLSSHKAKYKLKGTGSCAQFCSVHSRCLCVDRQSHGSVYFVSLINIYYFTAAFRKENIFYNKLPLQTRNIDLFQIGTNNGTVSYSGSNKI